MQISIPYIVRGLATKEQALVMGSLLFQIFLLSSSSLENWCRGSLCLCGTSQFCYLAALSHEGDGVVGKEL